MPARQSSVDRLVAEILAIGAAYHRYLHQDEFGPTRAERMQALRELLIKVDGLVRQMDTLSPELASHFQEKITGSYANDMAPPTDPVESYDAERRTIEVVMATAQDAARAPIPAGFEAEAASLQAIAIAAGRARLYAVRARYDH